MSVRQDASTEGLTRTASLPSATAFTIAGWFRKRGVGDNSWEHIAGLLSSGGSTWMVLYSKVAGTNNCVIHGASGDSSLNIALVTGNWYYFAIGCNGTGPSALTGWIITDAGVVYTASTFGFAMTPAEMSLLKSTAYGEWNNGAMANVKVWSVKLTTAELQTQRVSLATVVQTGNIHLSSELRVHTDLTDNSGNGRNWTSMGGSLSSEEDPPGLYSGGTTYYSTPSGILVPAGAILRRPTKLVSGVIPFSAILNRKTAKSQAGSMTFSGIVGASILKLKAIGGALSMAGTMARKSSKNLIGAISPSAMLTKLSGVSIFGTLNPSGVLSRVAKKLLSGVIFPVGSSIVSKIASTFTVVLSGSLTPSGSVLRGIHKAIGGVLTAFGGIIRGIRKSTSGSIGPSGNLFLDVYQATRVLVLGGVIAMTGGLTKVTSTVKSGYLVPQGLISRLTTKNIAGSVTFQGSISRGIRKVLSGILGFIGAVLFGDSITRTPSARTYSIVKEVRTYPIVNEVRYFPIGEDKK